METIRKGQKENAYGYTTIADLNGANSDMLMDFGVLRLKRAMCMWIRARIWNAHLC